MSDTRPRALRMTCLLVTATAVAGALISSGSAQALTGPEASAGQYAHAAKLSIGDEPHSRACTATLVNARWVLTAAACLADQPGGAIVAGAPRLKAIATFAGGQTREIVEVSASAADRDLVLARLATPVTDITPVKRATAAPVVGSELTAVGYGRTKTEWVPGKAHTGAFTTNSSDATTLAITGKGTDAICKGDTGGPLLNAAGELVAINSRSWQGGCLGEAETRTGAASARTDDLGDWIDRVTGPRNGSQVSLLAGGGGTMWSQSGDLGYGEYGQSWGKVEGQDIARVTSVRSGEYVRAYGIAGGRVYSRDLNTRTNQWSSWGEIPGGAAGTRDIAASVVNNVVHLQIAGADGSLYTQVGDYNAGRWNNTWSHVGASGLTNVTSVAAGTTVRLYAVADGRVYGRDLNTQNGSWTGWGQLPGGAADVKDIAASLVGNNVELQIIGGDGAVWMQYGNYDTGYWNDAWTRGGGSDLTRLSSSPVGKNVNVYAVGASGKVLNATLQSGPGIWSAWREVPGGLGGAADVSAVAIAAPTKVTLAAGGQGTLWSQQGDLNTGSYGGQWGKVEGQDIARVTSVAAEHHVRYYGIAGGRVYGRDLDTRTNQWSSWGEIPGGAAGTRDIAASVVNNVVHLQIAGADGSLYTQVGDYNAGRWNNTWNQVGASGLTNVTSVAAGTTVRLYAIADGRVYGRDLNTQNGSWTGWGELPGGAADVKDIAASLVGNNVELQIIGGAGGLWLQYGNYDAGRWNNTWTDAGGTGLSRVTSTASGKNVHVYTVGASGKVSGSILVSGPGTFTAWKELPGGLTGVADVTAAAGK
ncbi:trypsin-like serine protease [Streptomyces sp. NPDC048606]|uniref:trypsin-like serine protease n=1 Tax=Streptomyces sp. NPDC048606 TaxID=3154726 RepID=UPI003448608F